MTAKFLRTDPGPARVPARQGAKLTLGKRFNFPVKFKFRRTSIQVSGPSESYERASDAQSEGAQVTPVLSRHDSDSSSDQTRSLKLASEAAAAPRYRDCRSRPQRNMDCRGGHGFNLWAVTVAVRPGHPAVPGLPVRV